MTTNIDIVNRALASIGTRTTVASFLENSNEAKQANLLFFSLRDELIRLAPWNSTTNYAVLQMVTAVPGTPENRAVTLPTFWNKTLPAPPWAYEYAYPADCLKALFVIPQFQTGFTSGVPITTAVTGGIPNYWNGPPVRFRVAVDQPTTVGSVNIVNGGANYAVGDSITLAGGTGVVAILSVTSIGGGGVITGVSVLLSGSYTTTPVNPVSQSSTTGSGTGATFNLFYSIQVASATVAAGGTGYAIGDAITLSILSQLVVTSINAGGVITGVSVLLPDTAGSQPPANPVPQASTTGSGTGATFNLTYTTTFDQKVILTNQENAILAYCKRVTDPNQWDSQLQQAMIAGLAARLAPGLTGDDRKAQAKLGEANAFIIEARKSDGNEGLTINDVTPDWIRVRGIDFSYDPAWDGSPTGLEWGPLLSLF